MSLVTTTKVIPRQHLAREADLMMSKWPAYRFMSPEEATALFIDAYKVGVKNYTRQTNDIELAERIQPAKSLCTTHNNRYYTQAWMARQVADELGMPYPAYMEFCFDFAGRRRRRTTPQMNQLGPSAATATAWNESLPKFWTLDRWSIEMRRMEPDARYCIDYNLDLPAQRKFKEEATVLS